MTDGKNIRELYFEYAALAAHFPGCGQPENVFEVTQYQDRGFDGETRRITLRLACHECGSVFFTGLNGYWPFTEQTSGDQVGYSRGPDRYYITRTKDRPRSHEDVVGLIGWHLGRRGGVKWYAGAGVTDHGAVQDRVENLSSRRAAVAWVATAIESGVSMTGETR